MRKFYFSFLAFVAMMQVSPSTHAQSSFTLPEENEILQSEAYNYRLYKNVDFSGKTINGEEIPGGVITFDDAMTTTEIKYNGYVPYRCSVEGLSNLWCATSTPNTTDRGIQTNGSGPRGLLFSEMKAGQVIVLQGINGGYNTGETSTDYNGFCIPNGSRYSDKTGWKWEYFDPTQVEDISAEIHGAQDQAATSEKTESEGDEPEATHDSYLYLRVLQDGWVSIPMERSAIIVGFQIWIDAGAGESVTAPSLQVVKVNGDARQIEFKAGESTYGNAVTTYYTLDGTDPLFLKDSDEIDHYEEYQVDGEGIPVTDGEGNPIPVPESAVYKRVLDTEKVEAEGVFGDGEVYNPEDGSIDVYAAADEDGDGIVVVKAASVSEETGVVSEVVTINVSVGVITLDAPTLTLSGIDGKERTYTIGWNTKCMVVGDETYKFIVENAEGAYNELEENTGIGSTVTSTEWVKVTVLVEGYADGTTDQVDVSQQGIDMKKRTVGNEQSEEHNWDFCNLKQDVIEKLSGTVDHYAIFDDDGNETATYTVEEYESGESEIPTDKLVEVKVYHGWDGPDNRNANRHWRTWRPTYEEDDDGNPTEVIASTAYAEETLGLFKDLEVDNDHPSYSTMAIFADQSGLYFMTRGTIVVTPVIYGEYVMLTTNAGTTVTQYLDTENPCTLSVGQGTYIYAIDIFTYDDLPSPPDPEPEPIEDAINSVAAASNAATFYTISGVKLAAPQKGINIVKYSNGVTRKVLVK